ncbi:MAG: acetate--CoA ligase [Alphaproteobacteria bacterium]|nr:acetate--CoA ligase [Alphaproteobacteria bacterium]
MSTLIAIPEDWKKNALVTAKDYRNMTAAALVDPDAFWWAQASEFVWRQPWSKVKNTNFDLRKGPVSIRWFEGGRLNITENCLDRHLPHRAEQTAFIWEGDNPEESKHISYRQLFDEVCRFANVLKKNGVKKGDRVTIYLPMISEAAVAMLACARIGAVHSVVFAGFSAEALAGRITDCESKIIITADEGYRGGKTIPLKNNVDAAIVIAGGVEKVIVVQRTGGKVVWSGHDLWYHEQMAAASPECPAEIMEAEDPLFILYTSGSTGKPKGVLHTIGGYMIWVGMTFKYTFDYRAPPTGEASRPSEPSASEAAPHANDRMSRSGGNDIFWCSADVGWVTGHSYSVYGPLLNGAISVLFEGVPNYPDSSRFWKAIDKHNVTIFYTAPTAIRALMREGDAPVKSASRKSLRLLGSVGEPINPEAWLWYHRVVGDGRCPIVDTWWQTETGGQMMTPLPGAHALKPGAASFPYFGVEPRIVDQQGAILKGACEGLLCIADSWPGQARTIYGDHKRFEETYFSQYPGLYFTGDGAKRDEDGYYWITGRVDDVLNVSGHRIGTAEVESALVGHAHVTEAAVVGYPHDVKGQGIYCYVTLAAGTKGSAEITKELKDHVRKAIGPIATPDVIHFTPQLPKTRSGKIMRRILRKIAEGETDNLGDTSTLTNPEIVAELIAGKR